MDGLRDYHIEVSQTVHAYVCIQYHLHVESKKKLEIHLFKKQAHRHRKQTNGYQNRKQGEGENEKFVINRYILIYL